MVRKALRSFYNKICISNFISRLQSLQEVYGNGDHGLYVQDMQSFFSEVLNFPAKEEKGPPTSTSTIIRSYELRPDNSITSVYVNHADLLLKTEQYIGNDNAEALYKLSSEWQQFLNSLYQAVSSRKAVSKQRGFILPIAGGLVLLVLFIVVFLFLKNRYHEEREQFDLLKNHEVYRDQTVKDVLALKAALEKYYTEHKSYPKSGGGYDAVVAPFGESKKDYIPGLAPQYIDRLPVDPRKSDNGRKQYMYKSDGTDFKLIAHNPVDVADLLKLYPELVDPARPSWAIGVWTEGAKNW